MVDDYTGLYNPLKNGGSCDPRPKNVRSSPGFGVWTMPWRDFPTLSGTKMSDSFDVSPAMEFTKPWRKWSWCGHVLILLRKVMIEKWPIGMDHSIFSLATKITWFCQRSASCCKFLWLIRRLPRYPRNLQMKMFACCRCGSPSFSGVGRPRYFTSPGQKSRSEAPDADTFDLEEELNQCPGLKK